jgi:hypothetical protein
MQRDAWLFFARKESAFDLHIPMGPIEEIGFAPLLDATRGDL